MPCKCASVFIAGVQIHHSLPAMVHVKLGDLYEAYAGL